MSGAGPSEAAIFLNVLSRCRFAEIMREHREGEDCALLRLEPFGKLHQCVEAKLGMCEHVAFRVPFRFLRRSAQSARVATVTARTIRGTRGAPASYDTG